MPEGIDLSIIIPNFNSGNLLDLTLASIFSKESVHTFEVLIMDNLSTDDPQQYIDNYPKGSIVYHSAQDSGIYDAMNKGLKLAKGNWVIFFGAGDTINLVEVSKIKFKNYDFVYANTRLASSSYIYDGEFDKMKLLDRNISHQAILYNRRVFELYGLFNTKYELWADYLFNLELFFKSNINYTYVDLIISTFHGEGVSDINKDLIFSREKKILFFKLLTNNFSLDNLFVFIKYFCRNFYIKYLK